MFSLSNILILGIVLQVANQSFKKKKVNHTLFSNSHHLAFISNNKKLNPTYIYKDHKDLEIKIDNNLFN